MLYLLYPTQGKGVKFRVSYNAKPQMHVYGFPDAEGNFSGVLADMLYSLGHRLNFALDAKGKILHIIIVSLML